MSDEAGVRFIDLIKSLSMGMDLISSAVRNHHVRVGFLSAHISYQMGFSPEVQRDLLIAGLMHDAGALSYRSRLDALQFETDGRAHSEAGYRLVTPYPRLARVAQYIRHHHDAFCDIRAKGDRTLLESNVLTLADRVDVLIDREKPVGPQMEGIRKKVADSAGSLFHPRYVEAFCEISLDPVFQEQAQNPQEHLCTLAPEKLENEKVSHNELLEYTRLFSRIIDYRSSFTATHSSGVAETAAALAEFMDFSPTDRDYMRIAGNLHDLGKLAVPDTILEKPAPLDDDEWSVMRGHPDHCRNILCSVPGLSRIARWACNHHERMDGKGYPRGIGGEDLSIGCQILAAADVFTAITEDRPYREGMPFDMSQAVLKDMSRSALRGDVVDVLLDNYNELNRVRKTAQQNANRCFIEFQSR